MFTRILTALVGAPLLLLFAWLGGAYLAVAVAVLILLIQNESVGLLRELNPHRGLVFAGGLILVGGSFFSPTGFPGTALIALLLLYLVALVLFFPRFSPASCAGTLLAALYPGLLVHVYLIRLLPGGWEWLLLVLLATWGFDTFGYLAGKLVGRTRITPTLSPKKTAEGFAGGVLAGVVVTGAVGFILDGALGAPLVLLGLLIGVGAQVGDLLASALKRHAGVKDAGRLLPGHGGVLDRFDSLL
ncbi:MAG: phosphatidate cytidylyltransferase, partial [Candidatus Desulforudis sp.]|nr:phosphatidate cytidylyltransferase [Desulforudis sp.]